MAQSSGSTPLTRLLKPVVDTLNAEAARALIALRADRRLQARVDRLAGKCNEGELSADERAEYEAYVRANDIIAIMQALARRRFRSNARTA